MAEAENPRYLRFENTTSVIDEFAVGELRGTCKVAKPR